MFQRSFIILLLYATNIFSALPEQEILEIEPGLSEEISIPFERVQSRIPSRLSLMPQGLDSAMSEGEVADLLAYLISLK